MKTVVICEGCSSATLYVEEVFYRNWKAIIVNPPRIENDLEVYSEIFRRSVGDRAEIINMKSEDEYGPLVEKLKKMDIVAVVAGSEYGITYADRLSKDLGLYGNDPSDTYLRITKYGMYEGLKKAGIRRIETMAVKSEEDIDRFWKNNNIKTAFMKQDIGSSSFGCKLCATREEAKKHYRKLCKETNLWGVVSDTLIQEYIGGTEYIVNTVSCNGRHYITDIWKYDKVRTDTGEIIYNTCTLLMSPDIDTHELVNYAFKVLDATGFKFGPCHGEYKIDEKGPVLIETNARPMGANMRSAFLDECLCHHITDIALDTYVSPENFSLVGSKLYKPIQMAGMVIMVVPKDLDADLTSLDVLMKSMKTYRCCDPPVTRGIKHYKKTIDLESSPYTIKLCGSDADVKKDMETLQKLEFKYSDMLFSAFDKLKKGKQNMDLKNICKFFDRASRILVVSNGGNMLSSEDSITDVTDDIGLYDGCVFAKTDCGNLVELYHSIINAVSRMREGGVIVFLPGVYENLPYSSASIGIIMDILHVRQEIPLVNIKGIIYGVKQ